VTAAAHPDGATGGGPVHHVDGPLTGQGGTAKRILRALPAWFGIESALLEYAAAADSLPTFAVRAPAAEPGPTDRHGPGPATPDDGIVGFLTLRPTSAQAAEVHVLAVLQQQHRRGIGRALVERAATYARAEGFTLLHVKTLAPSDPDPGYAATRRFYEALGFLPLEELPQVWGPENPCLIMVRPL
jgi:GNAT superfamily N-acetyltransferase